MKKNTITNTKTKVNSNIKKYINVFFMALSILLIVFVLIFFATKNILPDLLGDVTINNIKIESKFGEILLDKKAPYFDLSDTMGNKVSLKDFQSKPTMLVFWATWNKESTNQIKILDDYLANNNIQSSLIKTLAINSLEEASMVKSFIKRGGYSVYAALDIKGTASKSYNIKSLPTTYFVDASGIVKEIYSGVLSERMIVDKVENLLK